MITIFYFLSMNFLFADTETIIRYFREKPAELIKLEFFHQITSPIYSSQKSYESSEQSPIQVTLDVKQKTINPLENSKLAVLSSRTIKENSVSFSAGYSMQKHGVFNSLTPSVFIQKQQSDIDAFGVSSTTRYSNTGTIYGTRFEYDLAKNGARSTGYLQNQRLKAQSYRGFSQGLSDLNQTYKQIQQNLLNLYSLQCRLNFAESNNKKLIEAERKIDLAFKINLVTYSHVLNIREQLNSNEAQKQSIENDLNRLVNYFNSIDPNRGESLKDEIKKNFECEFDKSFVEKISTHYELAPYKSNLATFKFSSTYHVNLSSFQSAEAGYKITTNKVLPDFKPYLQFSKGSNSTFNTNYNDNIFEVGVTLSWGADPLTIRNEIMAQSYSREAALVKLNYTGKVYRADIARITKSIELRKKLIFSAQKALEASDNQIKYNESQRGVRNIDTLTMINGFRTRIQSVTTLVDAFVALEQDYTELITSSDWKYVERMIK
jgi:hypothetical protein